MNENGSSSTASVLMALLGGAAVGAGLALLFAPRSGRATRRRIGALAEDAEEGVEKLFNEAAQELKAARQKGAAWVDELKARAADPQGEAHPSHDGTRP